jgi:membrane protein implicated in regulation of membrane protease activity
MGTAEVAFLERLVSGSPLIVAASFVAIWVLWKRLSDREKQSDQMVREMLEATHKMTSAVEALTDAIKHPPR